MKQKRRTRRINFNRLTFVFIPPLFSAKDKEKKHSLLFFGCFLRAGYSRELTICENMKNVKNKNNTGCFNFGEKFLSSDN